MVDIYPATNRPGKCPPLAVDANYINPRGGGKLNDFGCVTINLADFLPLPLSKALSYYHDPPPLPLTPASPPHWQLIGRQFAIVSSLYYVSDD